MGLYGDRILPRLIDWTMNNAGMRTLRTRAAAGLHGTVVELGFGSGLNLPHYPADVERLYAIDPATLGRTLAADRLKEVSFPVEFPSLRGERLDLDDGVADCVLVTWTLCTIPDVRAALGEARRVLKPGGTLHFVEHGRAPDPGPARWQDRLDATWRRFSGGCSLTRSPEDDLRAAGFEVEVEQFYGHGPRFTAAMRIGTATRD